MVTLSPLVPEECTLVASWLNSRELSRWLTSEWRTKEITPQVLAIATRSKRNRFLIVRHDDIPCGLVGFSEYDEEDRVAMLWYLLGERHLEGRGIISQAVAQAVDYGFAEMKLASIYAWIMEDNIGSKRVLEKSGFREVGRIRNAARSADCQVDRVYFDRTSPSSQNPASTSSASRSTGALPETGTI